MSPMARKPPPTEEVSLTLVRLPKRTPGLLIDATPCTSRTALFDCLSSQAWKAAVSSPPLGLKIATGRESVDVEIGGVVVVGGAEPTTIALRARHFWQKTDKAGLPGIGRKR